MADIRTWRAPQPLDGALCRGVLNDLVDDDGRQSALDNLALMLRAGGLLVLGVRELERTLSRYKREPVVTRSEEGVFFRSETHLVGDVMHVQETISSDDARADHDFRMRPWTLTEVDERTAGAGFTRVERRLEGDRIVAVCFR